mgnify:CR=1 FL=1
MQYTNGQTVHLGDRVRGHWSGTTYDVEGIVEDIDEQATVGNLWVSWMAVDGGFSDKRMTLATASAVFLIASWTGNWSVMTPPVTGDLPGEIPDIPGDPI